MDIYSLGVLLFVLLCGRKPWDAQTSHTLQYAVLDHSKAPGFKDARFTSLSPAAQELLKDMLANKGKQRPSAQQVLQHKWLQTCQSAAAAGNSSSEAKGKAGSSIHDSVQRRLQVLANSRRVMGTARGLLLMHTGTKKTAAAYHIAVREAHRKLQEQAAALKESGGLQLLEQHQHQQGHQQQKEQQQQQLEQLQQQQQKEPHKQQEGAVVQTTPANTSAPHGSLVGLHPNQGGVLTAAVPRDRSSAVAAAVTEGRAQSSSEGGGVPAKPVKLTRKSHPGILSALMPTAVKTSADAAAVNSSTGMSGDKGEKALSAVTSVGAAGHSGGAGKPGGEKFTMRELVKWSLAGQTDGKGLSDGGGAAAAAVAGVGLPPVMVVRGMSGPVFLEAESSMAMAVAAGPLAK